MQEAAAIYVAAFRQMWTNRLSKTAFKGIERNSTNGVLSSPKASRSPTSGLDRPQQGSKEVGGLCYASQHRLGIVGSHGDPSKEKKDRLQLTVFAPKGSDWSTGVASSTLSPGRVREVYAFIFCHT